MHTQLPARQPADSGDLPPAQDCDTHIAQQIRRLAKEGAIDADRFLSQV